MASLFRPDSWPLATRTAADLLVAAVLPLTLCAILLTWQSRRALEVESHGNLKLVAAALASQVDQLLDDVRGRLTQVADDERVVRFCVAEGADRAALAGVIQEQLRRIRRDDLDVASIFITDADGIGINSTHDHNIGQDLTFREYWRAARAGRRHMSDMLVGTRSREAGIYFSSPVLDGDRIVGVAVLKLDGRRLQQLVDALPNPEAEAALSTADGVVLVHRDRDKTYRSFGPLDEEVRQRVDARLTFGIERIDDLGLPDLMAPLRSMSTGAVPHRRIAPTGESERWMIGFAPLRTQPWMASVAVPLASFEAPIVATIRQQLAIAVVLALGAAVYAFIRSPRLVLPIVRLTSAATRVADGDLEVRVPADRDDEIGRLGRAFNAMIPRLRERLELRQSIAVAREMQQALLPAADPRPPRLEVCGRSRPCDETGGDYFDFIEIVDLPGRTLVAVGDVVGHGIGSALVMASARGALRAALADRDDLAEAVETLNLIISQDSREGRFMTLLLLELDTDAGTVRWVSAGHDPAMVIRPGCDEVDELEGADLPLGVLHDTRYRVHTAAMPPEGSIVLVGTDGIWEARNTAGEMFGKSRLRAILLRLRARTATEIATELEAELSRFGGDRRFDDDVTYVIVRIGARRDEDGPPDTERRP